MAEAVRVDQNGDPLSFRVEARSALKKHSRCRVYSKADQDRLRTLIACLDHCDLYHLPRNAEWSLDLTFGRKDLSVIELKVPAPEFLIEYQILALPPGVAPGPDTPFEETRRLALVCDLRSPAQYQKMQALLNLDPLLKTVDQRDGLVVLPVDNVPTEGGPFGFRSAGLPVTSGCSSI